MKFWEAMKALQEGKKVKPKHWDACDFLDKQDITEGYLLDFTLIKHDWEIYEEPNPEIKLTPEMVGRKVRLTNGDIVLITLYSIDSLQWSAWRYWSRGEKNNANAK